MMKGTTKKLCSALLVLALLLMPAVPALAAGETDAQTHVTVNGVEALLEAYAIDGECYGKLRDLAMLFSGTGCQFDVGWDADTRTVSLTTGRPYMAPDGSELCLGRDRSAAAAESAQTFLVDGVTCSGLQIVL